MLDIIHHMGFVDIVYLSHKWLIRGVWYQVMLLKIAVRHFEKGPGKLGTDEWILMKDVGQEQQLN